MSIFTLDEAARARQGKRLVFTNGVFDILHAGHVRLLEQARSLGEMLIVGVNSDESVRSLGKAPGRPVNQLVDRQEVLAALRCVDGVVSFPEPTPLETIRFLKPEVHVKGGDYDKHQLPETPLVESYGGEVVILPFLAGRSTTSMLERIRATEG